MDSEERARRAVELMDVMSGVLIEGERYVSSHLRSLSFVHLAATSYALLVESPERVKHRDWLTASVYAMCAERAVAALRRCIEVEDEELVAAVWREWDAYQQHSRTPPPIRHLVRPHIGSELQLGEHGRPT